MKAATFMTHVFEILQILQNFEIPAIPAFQAHIHVEKHDFV